MRPPDLLQALLLFLFLLATAPYASAALVANATSNSQGQLRLQTRQQQWPAPVLQSQQQPNDLHQNPHHVQVAQVQALHTHGQAKVHLLSVSAPDPPPDTVCRLHKQGRNDPCKYVSTHAPCTSEDQLFHYLPGYYCARAGHVQPVMFVVYLLWLLLLFFALSEVAEDFLVPAVEWISEQLKLTPAVAGVTLLSFAGGAPDLFTELAAITAGEQIDLGLAISSCMGSGLFIACVVTASVVLIRPIEIMDRTALVRDIAAYMLACVLLLQLMWTGQLTALPLLCLLLLYVIYVGVAIHTSRHQAPVVSLGRHASLRTHSTSERSLELPSWTPRPPQTPASPTIPAVPGVTAVQADLPPVVITARSKDLSLSRSVSAIPRKGKESFDIEVFATSKQGIATSRSMSEGTELPEWTGPRNRTTSTSSTGEHEQAPMFRTMPSSSAPVPPPPSPATTTWHAFWLHLCQVYNEYIPLKRQNRFQLVIGVLTAPVVIMMHLTNPSLHIESYGLVYSAILSSLAPGFALFGLGCGPDVTTPAGFVCLWVGFSIAIFAAMWYQLRRSEHLCAKRANGIIAGLSFVMSAVWLSVIAKEVVALLEAFGHILNLSADMIGGTILSWGETVPELVATYTLAKAGQGTMAIAACFAGPAFNLLVGLAGPVLYVVFKKGPLPVQLTNGITLLTIQSVVVLALLLVMIPVAYRWQVPQKLGVYLLIAYVVFQVMFVLTEADVIWTQPWSATVVKDPDADGSRQG